MIIEYYFDDDVLEYKPDITYEYMRKLLNERTKEELIDMLTDYVDCCDLAEQFEDEIREDFESSAYEEYQNELDWLATCSEIEFGRL